MRFVIDRSKWKTATHGEGQTYLLNESEYRCCLGFLCQRIGFSDDEILGIGRPAKIRTARDHLYEYPFNELVQVSGLIMDSERQFISGDLAVAAVRINDNLKLTDSQRESELKKLFGNYKIEVEFVGEYET